jgi:hypothetical protein
LDPVQAHRRRHAILEILREHLVEAMELKPCPFLRDWDFPERKI